MVLSSIDQDGIIIVPDRDAFIEWSPSRREPGDSGLHIPLAGFEPPEWWSDNHFSDDEHEGVEAYGSKFFTVTGDRLHGAGDTVADTGEWGEEWLAQVHKSLIGEDPRNRPTEGGFPESHSGGSAGGTGTHDHDHEREHDRELPRDDGNVNCPACDRSGLIATGYRELQCSTCGHVVREVSDRR